jgi:exodeoxyribonuclease V beta subunit
MSRFPRPACLPDVRARFVVVEASAGTGKTHFLEHRVADLVVAGIALEQILVVTFTDKAVAELRARIRDLLDRMARADGACDALDAWELDDAARTRLRAAVGAFDRAQIFTIHGFCHRVLVEDAFAARRLFEQTQVADEIPFDAAFEALLTTRFAKDEPDRGLLAAYLGLGHTVDQVRALLLEAARKGLPPRRTYDEAAILELGDALRAALAAGTPRPALGHHDRRRLDEITAAFARDAHDAPSVLTACDDIRGTARKLVDSVGSAAADSPLVRALRALLAGISLEEAIVSRFLPPILERARVEKAERGWFDYDDMLELVRDTLADRTSGRGDALAARLRARTPCVLIDEFQDTDAIQWEIFRTVWLHDDARTLTIVGDPKQAIYSFRGADVATYLRARDQLLALGAMRVELIENWRSSAPLVRAIDAVLAGDIEGPLLDPRHGIAYDRPVHAASDIMLVPARAPVVVLELADASRDRQHEALADAIGRELDQLRAAPPRWQVRGREHVFALADVMVLTRTNTETADIAAVLRARGLPCAVVESDKLFATREAAELRDVLEAIASPRDRSARLRALRTRFFAVPWRALASIVDAPDYHPAMARLYEWAALAQRRAYEPLFRRLIDDSGFAARAIVLGGGERAIVNTWHVLELLLEQLAIARCDLHELAALLRRWIADDGTRADDRDVQRIDHDGDAVRVMTIHKAKGLEAPFVFVYGGTGAGRTSRVHTVREGEQRAIAVDPPDLAIVERARDERDAELQRLAYVALTRGQLRTYLPVYADGGLKPSALYATIQRGVIAARARQTALFATVEVPIVERERARATPALLATLDVPPPPPRHEVPALPAARARLEMWSYTRLARHATALDEPDVVEPGSALPLAPDELPRGAGSGIFVHDLLEHADLDAIRRLRELDTWQADRDVQSWLADRARATGLDQRYLRHAGAIVHRALSTPLLLVDGSTLPPLCDAPALAREVEFAYPIPSASQRGFVRGFIDALVAWHDELWVVDYKSDVLVGDPLAAARSRARETYAMQAKLYAIAAQRVRGTRRLAGVLFAFVRHGIVAPRPVTDAELEAWTSELGQLRPEDVL